MNAPFKVRRNPLQEQVLKIERFIPQSSELFNQYLHPLIQTNTDQCIYPMEDFITFNGLKHYAIGNAKLHQQEKGLAVTNLATPLDGIGIDTTRTTYFDLDFSPVFIENDSNFGVTFNQTDNRDGFRPIAQWAIAQHPETATAYLFLNSRLEGEQISVRGLQSGNTQFHRIFEQTDLPGINWMVIGVFNQEAERTSILGIDCRLSSVRNTNGVVTEVTAQKSFRCKGAFVPAVDMPSIHGGKILSGGQRFAIDSLQIKSSQFYPSGLVYDKESYITQAAITGQGMPCLVLNQAQAGG